jgi:hypothetical protein
VAGGDIETDVVEGTEDIICMSVSHKENVRLVYLKRWISDIEDPVGETLREAKRLIPSLIKDRNLNIEVLIADTPAQVVMRCIEKLHEWKPDWFAFWNMDFDIPRILERLKEKNVNPVDVICDKTVPRKYRICRYKQGIKKKVTASGVVKPINPSLQWHSLLSTSSFYVIDAMCVYRQLRMAKQEEQSYSLDAILRKEEIGAKLKFKEADHLSGEKWHVFMQANYPVEYIIYNFYDCLGMLELDEKIKDLKSSLPSFAAITDFMKFNSNPKKIVDALFLFGLERDRVIGTVPKQARPEEELEAEGIETDDEEDEEDEYDVKKYNTLDLKGWIQLLPQNLLLAEGLKCLEEVESNLLSQVCYTS